MFLGRVVGEVWATRKADDLAGKRLLVVEALDEQAIPPRPRSRRWFASIRSARMWGSA
jgi:microcompartment protein CcmK/EutM